ncbi:glucose-6-phosphate isomerase [bacterium MnTg02]|nr:glucose-6-phosphate isomerase [bacterium MnTg02]
MGFQQSIDSCLEKTIGSIGLSDAALTHWLEKLSPHLEKLKQTHVARSLPLLHVPERMDDIEAAEQALDKLCKNAGTLVFFGTGGSSLGGQTIAQLGGWNIPGDRLKGQKQRPRTRIYDNLDPRTLDGAFKSLDLATTRFVVISKSGSTAETLCQAIVALSAVKEAGLESKIPKLFLGVTEPAKDGQQNGLRALFTHYKIPMLDHDPDVGGRFSALTNVGLLPGLARGLDVRAIRKGALAVVAQALDASRPDQVPAAIGAAVCVGLAKEKGITNMVMMPYADRLEQFASWYVQLWAESLGKDGEGSTPVAALGPVDQHSQLQLYMDGAPRHMVTVLRTACRGIGPVISPELALKAGAGYLAGKFIGDLVQAQQSAVPQALAQAGRPVRTFDIDPLDEEALGGLMMHFMLETILAAGLLGIDPFDQPAVETGKRLTREKLAHPA